MGYTIDFAVSTQIEGVTTVLFASFWLASLPAMARGAKEW
jgi:hypothetical protein